MNAHDCVLEFDRILQKLAEHAHGAQAREQLLALSPMMDETLCNRAILDTSGARRLLECCGTPPIAVMDGIQECIHLAKAGAMLQPDQLYQIARFIVACNRMTDYLRHGESCEDRISFYGRAFADLSEMKQSIESSVDEERVFDDASPTLRKLRREMENLEARMRDKLHQLAQSKKKWLADTFVSKRNGHFVLPVLKQYQSQFAGNVIDFSRSGGTVFMEPASVAGMQQEWNAAAIEEEQEVRRILYTLSDLVVQHSDALGANARLMDDLDVLFAKGSFSLELDAREVMMSRNRKLLLHQARHPLLDAKSCVALDLELDETYKGMVITGPNTGGKTVALKTVGLLTLMAQSGLHIPCGEGSSLPMRDAVYCDIGDNQSISQNLSTFSGHMTNVIDILDHLSHDSLVLLDELGSGTDPAEGMGIAIAVLEALRLSGCCFLATTHYEQVKAYVQHTSDLMSARMAFDAVSLRPLYKLEMGKTGKSCALEIVKRLGMPQTILECASRVVQEGCFLQSMPSPRLKRKPSRLISRSVAAPHQSLQWQMGDSVEVLPEREKGIVFQPADEYGNVIVQIKGEKKAVRHTRLRLLVPAAELYPEDYDFSIIFDTVENRKARHVLSKRYDADATVVIQEGRKE